MMPKKEKNTYQKLAIAQAQEPNRLSHTNRSKSDLRGYNEQGANLNVCSITQLRNSSAVRRDYYGGD
jgi:hypothetical protein